MHRFSWAADEGTERTRSAAEAAGADGAAAARTIGWCGGGVMDECC